MFSSPKLTWFELERNWCFNQDFGRKKDKKFKSLEVREASSSHFKTEAISLNITKSFCMFIPAYKKNTCLILVIWLWAFTRSPNSFEFFLLKRRRNRGKNDFVAGGDLEISIWWGSFSGWFRSGLFLFTRVGILWKRNSLHSMFTLKRKTYKTIEKNWAKLQCLNDKIPVTLREPL